MKKVHTHDKLPTSDLKGAVMSTHETTYDFAEIKEDFPAHYDELNPSGQHMIHHLLMSPEFRKI